MKLWDDFVQAQEIPMGKELVAKWLKPLKVVHFDARNLYLEAEDPFAIHWFEQHMRAKVCKNLVNNNNAQIKVHLALKETLARAKKQKKIWKPVLNLAPDSLDPHATFDLFISGGSNALPVKLLQNVLDRKENFNPLFLSGPSGSGKTHLLMAASHYLKKKKISCFYVRAETFTEHLIAAIRNGATTEFRKLYRNHDFLLVDDIGTIGGRNATQEEFFHMFNTLHASGKQMIFAGRDLPNNCSHIEPRLTSRFEWGLVLSLSKLKFEDIRELILKRLDHFSFPLQDETIDYLLSQFGHASSSIVKALDALILSAHLKHENSQNITKIKASLILEKLLLEEKKIKLTPEKIISAVCSVCGTTAHDILGKSRTQECVLPRQIAIYFCREHLKISFEKIGEIFSRDHSTIMTSVKLIQKKLVEENKEISLLIREISQKIRF